MSVTTPILISSELEKSNRCVTSSKRLRPLASGTWKKKMRPLHIRKNCSISKRIAGSDLAKSKSNLTHCIRTTASCRKYHGRSSSPSLTFKRHLVSLRLRSVSAKKSRRRPSRRW